MSAVAPVTLDQLTDEALATLECRAERFGWDEIVMMCREEQQRRES